VWPNSNSAKKEEVLNLRNHLRALVFGSLIGLAPAIAVAQDDYPNRPIKIIVPFTAGSAPDILARILGERLQAKWGQPVVAEARLGATGNIGAEVVARAEPDGYTLLVSPPPPLVISQHVYRNLHFDPNTFVPVSIIATMPNVLVVRPELGVASVPDLIKLAKERPGKLTYGSPGVGGTPHLSAEMLKTFAGIDMVHVPYRGTTPVLTDMFGGRIDLTFANPIDTLPHIREGKLKAIGVGSPTRSALLPDVPTIAETLPGFLSTTWYAVVASPKTPPAIVAKLSAAVAEALKAPEVAARLRDLNATPVGSSPADAVKLFAEERERWGKVVKAAGVKLD
jgi:tripartite-type tricarboxylate transporter receptor subunit TctC